ncbi:MAG: MerR family transcriptional regulator [Cyclobacteriaceae bacterium]|nr:MAG: MerR family transcriptional regulator [Cyclobacteriaceae bacterium]
MKTSIDYMSKYSIKDLENLSGIKAHTLRIWEQRYGIIVPKRTPTNIRYYDSNDLKSVLKIARLREHGFKISKIATMTPEHINRQISSLAEQESGDPGNYIHFLTTAMIDLDEDLFERTLSTCILQLGLETTMYSIIHPFLTKIGTLWQTEAINPAQEHFISCLLRQKLIVAIDGQKLQGSPDGKKFLLYLPEGELHELSLLFSCYLLRKIGHQVIYLGQNLPFTDLGIAYQMYQPDIILCICTSFPTRDLIQSYLNDLSTNFPKATIFVSGFAIISNELTIPLNVKVLNQLTELKEKISQV